MYCDMAKRADCIGVEHRLGALPAHDLMEIEVDHGRFAASSGLQKHRACAGEVICHRLFGENRFAQLQRADCYWHLQTRQGSDGNRLHVCVLDELAPVAIGLGYSGVTGTLGCTFFIAAGKCDHLATRVGPESRQLHSTSIIAADYSQTDHVSKSRHL